MKDIEFKNETQKFKYRVNGIVIYNNKILTIKMKNNVSYCLPGGHVELGEDTGRLPEELTNTSEEEDLVNLLEYEALLKEFKKLPEKTQRIFNLFYVEDLPIDEISKVLKTPTGTIKAALSRTRRKLKNNLNV